MSIPPSFELARGAATTAFMANTFGLHVSCVKRTSKDGSVRNAIEVRARLDILRVVQGSASGGARVMFA